jgi:carbonic anhydrase
MEPLRWVYEREQISLHQREESYNSHKFDVKGMVRPHMELEGGGGVYTLQTIDVHSPSENAVDGVKFDVEVQFWHMAPGPKYMVVSAMFRKNVEKGSRSPPVFINEISRLLQKSVFKYNKLEPAVNFQSVIKV